MSFLLNFPQFFLNFKPETLLDRINDIQNLKIILMLADDGEIVHNSLDVLIIELFNLRFNGVKSVIEGLTVFNAINFQELPYCMIL